MFKYYRDNSIYIEIPLFNKVLIGDHYFTYVYLTSMSDFLLAVPFIDKEGAIKSSLPIAINKNLFFNSEGGLVILFKMIYGKDNMDYSFILNPIVGKAINVSNPRLESILEPVPAKFTIDI